MKTVLLPVFLFTILFSNNVFAIHAYRTEDCTSKTHELYYTGNYPIGGMYGIKLKGQEEDVSALPLFDASETPNTLEDAEVIYKELFSAATKKRRDKDNCWFEHDEWKSKKIIKILSISEESSKKLKLKKGEKIIFTCHESTDYPSGNECDN